MSVFNIPSPAFVNGTTITSDSHNDNWDGIKTFVDNLANGTGLDAGAITESKIANTAVSNAKLATNAVATSNIQNSAVTQAKLAAAVQSLLVPAGTVVATVKSTADTGWLLLDGTLTPSGMDVLYPSLWAVIPVSWKVGTAIQLPNMANRMLEGHGTTTLGATGGSNTASIAEANLPSHFHTVNPPSTTVTSATEVVTTSSPNPAEVVYNPNSYGAPGTDYRAVDQAYPPGPVTFGMSLRDASDGNSHTHQVTMDIAEFNSGPVGSGTALTVTNAHLAVNFQIKAH